jgi:hypothetical protein
LLTQWENYDSASITSYLTNNLPPHQHPHTGATMALPSIANFTCG